MSVPVSWPAYRLYQVVMAGNAKTTIAATARQLHLEESVVVGAIVELHRVGVVPDSALAAALMEHDGGESA